MEEVEELGKSLGGRDPTAPSSPIEPGESASSGEARLFEGRESGAARLPVLEMERTGRRIGYEYTDERDARACAAELDRRFTNLELRGLRIYRIVWNGNFLVEATFSENTPESRIADARALLGEAGSPVHPDDLEDYKRATESGPGLPGWLRRFFGDR